MPRPHRPNPIPRIDATEGTNDPRRVKRRQQGHTKQETRQEAKLRKREEAEERNALTPPERRRAYRLKRMKNGE